MPNLTIDPSKPHIGGLVRIPYALLRAGDWKRIEYDLTYRIKAFHSDEEDRWIKTYVKDDTLQMVALPYQYGLKQFQKLKFRIPDLQAVTYRSNGSKIKPPKLPDPDHADAPDGQDQFFADLLESASTNTTTFAVAPTGCGKTVAALYVAAKLGRTTLVVVHSKELALQWREEIKRHLGYTDNDIGILEGGKCFYKGKAFVVAVVHNTYNRRLPLSFKIWPGTLIFDEVDALAAESFRRSIGMFYACVRIGMTATPERRDGLSSVIYNELGEPNVHASTDALPCEVRVVDYPLDLKEWRFISRSTMLTRLSKKIERNKIVAKIVVTMYRDKRNVLVLSDRVDQLTAISALCEEQGVPSMEIGLYVRNYSEELLDDEGNPVLDLKKKPIRISKTFKEEHLTHVRETSRVILATYGMAKTAINIKRLDAGVDATPQATGKQAVGRIRRPFPNKRKPIWFTIRDTTVPVFRQMTKSRIKEYISAKCEVKDYGTP